MAADSNKWRRTKLGDLVKITHGWPFKSQHFSEEKLGRPVVVAIGNFQYTGGFRFDSTSIKEYAGDYPKDYELTPGDILLVMTCQTAGGEILGIPGRIPDNGKIFLHNQRMGKVVIKERDAIFPGFVYYLALSPAFNRELCATASGSKILHTSPGRIESVEFNLPSLPEQKAIAQILGTLDDKIELNRRMNATLEAMARALFQSWFVDFDPVHVLAGNKSEAPPFLSAEALAQAGFPVQFQESALGEVPNGWRVMQFRDILVPSVARVGEANLPEFSATINGLFLRSDRFTKQLSRSKAMNKRIVAGDLVFGLSRQVINFGLMRDGEGAVSPVYEIFKIDTEVIDPELLEKSLRVNMPFYMDILRPGAREGQPIDRKYLLSKLIVVPERKIQTRFQDLIGPLTAKMRLLDRESRTLTTLRDTLLPKLLSGGLRVEAAKRFAEASA
jgi:type I restriction enzyme S subunit